MGAGALLTTVRARRARRRRIAAAVGLVAVIVAGLCVHLWMPDSATSDITGDALYALAAWCAVVVIAPRLPPVAVGGIALAWCVAIELLQLTPVPSTAASLVPASMLVLGTVFDARDLLVYGVTVAAATAIDLVEGRRPQRG